MGCFDFVGDIFGGGETTVVQAPAPPPPTETELEIQKQILAQLKEQAVDKPLTEEEQLFRDLNIRVLEEQLRTFPEQQELLGIETELRREQLGVEELTVEALTEQLAAARRLAPLQEEVSELQLGFAREQLQAISEARNLGEITGDLTTEELGFFDDIANSAIDRLTETVNEERFETMQSEIADLVDRGVLEGDIGAKAIARIDEKALELISRGTADIESNKVAQILSRQEANRQFELETQRLIRGGALTAGQAATQVAAARDISPISGTALTQATALGQAALQRAVQSQQFGAGLQQQRTATSLTGGLGLFGELAGIRTGQAERALQASIATAEAKASERASMFGAFGNIAGLAGALAL